MSNTHLQYLKNCNVFPDLLRYFCSYYYFFFFSFVFHSSFMQCYPLGSSYLVGSVKYKFIDFFVFDYGSLPYLLSLSF